MGTRKRRHPFYELTPPYQLTGNDHLRFQGLQMMLFLKARTRQIPRRDPCRARRECRTPVGVRQARAWYRLLRFDDFGGFLSLRILHVRDACNSKPLWALEGPRRQGLRTVPSGDQRSASPRARWTITGLLTMLDNDAPEIAIRAATFSTCDAFETAQGQQQT